PSGKAASASPPLVGLLPERLSLHVERPWAVWNVVGIANWSDTEAVVGFDAREFGLDPRIAYHVVDLWSGAYLGLRVGGVELGSLAPHGLRLLSIHRDLGRPQTVGSTRHLLGDAMDLAGEDWNATTGVLTL